MRPLLRDESTEVASYALESAAKLKKREFVPLILSRLAQPSLQQAAAKTPRILVPKAQLPPMN